MTSTPKPRKAEDDGTQAKAIEGSRLTKVTLQPLTTGFDWTPLSDMDETIQRAADAARQAQVNSGRPNARPPNSAAVLTADGRFVLGFGVEDASLGQTMCTERVAMFAAITHNPHLVALAVCSPPTAQELTFPCDECLHVAVKLGGLDVLIVAASQSGSPSHTYAGELLVERQRKGSSPK